MPPRRPSGPEASAPSHRHRDVAESFGSEAERYDRTRPRYPPAVVRAVLGEVTGAPAVVDVGTGTGLAALPFRSAGCTVLGVEVDPLMAELARGRGFPVEIARFEDWDPAGRRFDAVVAGQTWHWIDPDAGPVRAASALRAGGVLAPFWNVADPPSELAAAFADVYRRIDTGLPFTPWATPARDGYRRILDAALEGIRASGRFDPPVEREVAWTTTVTRDEWLEQVPTFGGHGGLSPEVLAELLDGLGRAVDDAGGAFPLAYTTQVVVAVCRRAG